MACPPNRANTSPERSFTLQKYLLLHSQHDALQRNLHHINSHTITAAAPRPSPASALSSMSSSPERHSITAPPSLSSSPAHWSHGPLSASVPASPSPIAAHAVVFTDVDLSTEQAKLQSINQQIKTTLTELLNCESVRRDREYRMWVQSRLMAAERELRGGRRESCCERRRSSVAFAM